MLDTTLKLPGLSLFVLLGSLLASMPATDASSSVPDSIHFCAFDEQEQWRADHPRPAAKRPADLNVGRTPYGADDLLPT